MKHNELKEDKYIKDWLSGFGVKSTTKNGYIDSMRSYTEFIKKTPEQLIIESEEDIRSGKLMRERKIANDLREYREFLESSGLSTMTIKSRLTAVRSFYKFYDIYLPTLPLSATKARPRIENREIPTKEDIQEVIKVCDPLEKAIILTGVASGLSANEISNIKVKEFLDGYDPETEITTLHLVREKVGYEFYTFLTPEASRAIKEYIKYRERETDIKEPKRLESRLKQKIKYDKKGNPTGYLFICRNVVPEYLNCKNEKEKEEMRKLKSKTILKIYKDLNEKLGKSSTYVKRFLIRSHNMRKFFNSTLLANGATIFTTDFMMGHQIDSTRDAYFRADPKALREEYQKYIPFLTIQKELNVAESPEFIRIKGENEILARETAKATVERAEIQNLRSELEGIKGENEILAREAEKAIAEREEIKNLRTELDEMKKKKEEASQVSTDFLLEALKDPLVQEMLKNIKSE